MTEEEWNQKSGWEITIPKYLANPFPKFTLQSLLFTIIIGGFLLNQVLMWRVIFSGGLNNALPTIVINITKKNGK